MLSDAGSERSISLYRKPSSWSIPSGQTIPPGSKNTGTAVLLTFGRRVTVLT